MFHVEHKDFHSGLKISNIPLTISEHQYLLPILWLIPASGTGSRKSSTDRDAFCTADLRCALGLLPDSLFLHGQGVSGRQSEGRSREIDHRNQPVGSPGP